MTVEHQLERSMLDGKDREELHAIAGAMGVKAATRMRKADLVDAILAAVNGAGTAPASAEAAPSAAADDAPTKPRRVRSARASTVTEDPVAALAAEQDALALDEEPPPPRPTRRSRAASADPATTIPPTADTADTTSTNGDAPSETAAAADTTVSTSGDALSDAVGASPGTSSVAEATGAGSDSDTASSTETSSTTTTQSNQSNQSNQGNDGGQRPRDDDDRGPYEGNRRRRRRRGRDRTTVGGEPGPSQPSQPSQPSEPIGEPIDVQGLLDLRDEGYGFLRSTGYLPGQKDVYVSASQVRRFSLRKGDFVKGQTRPPASNEKYPALLRVDEINAMAIEEAKDRPRFEDLTPLFPDEKLALELVDDPQGSTGRIIDLISPIGKGQRGLIVSPPKAGKTTIMKQIVYSIERNNPEVHLMVLLVDERPEEVTDMRRHVLRGEVVASTFDRPSEEHTHVAELTIERAKRLVELGRDVVIVLDGITRLARAYNLATPASGRILSGGVDSTALYPPKRFFGAARNVEEGGSLTILATALVETGSRMDEVIFEEFKGTGNMELRLDRRLAERRIYPAIDVEQSSTRHEELLFERDTLQQVWKLRRVLNGLEGGAGLELLIDKIRTTRSNDEFMAEISKAPV